MASEVGICNTALTMLGADRINSLDEDTPNARECNAIYVQLRDEELTSHPWNFATVRVQLAQLVSTPTFGFDFAYSLPEEYLRIVAIHLDHPYRVEDNKLLSDFDPIKVEYIKRITDTTQFSFAFVSLLTARIAMELTYPITHKNNLIDTMTKRYIQKRSWALGVDSQEGTPRDAWDDTYIAARFSGLTSDRSDKNFDI